MKTSEFYRTALEHQKLHNCSGVPYTNGDLLTTLVMATGAKTILEVGTGIGYSAVCLAKGNPVSHIHTIDKSAEHAELAKKYIREYGVEEQVTVYTGIAEAILPTFHQAFDLVFYDGLIPQKKFVEMFHGMLRIGGLLVSTNLYLGDEKGGKYVQLLNDTSMWQTGIINDTSLSVKKSPKL